MISCLSVRQLNREDDFAIELHSENEIEMQF